MDRAVAIGADRKGVMSKRAVLAILLAGAVTAGLMLPILLDFEHPVMSDAWVRSTVRALGMAGRLALIGLMVLAIVASPIPIAVAAGSLYGTLWGGAFVVTGALLGAFAAFGAARYLGFDAVRRSTNPVLKYISAPRSQISLMLIVFGSRLIPFISFDAVSYAAGITCLSFGRFAGDIPGRPADLLCSGGNGRGHVGQWRGLDVDRGSGWRHHLAAGCWKVGLGQGLNRDRRHPPTCTGKKNGPES